MIEIIFPLILACFPNQEGECGTLQVFAGPPVKTVEECMTSINQSGLPYLIRNGLAPVDLKCIPWLVKDSSESF